MHSLYDPAHYPHSHNNAIVGTPTCSISLMKHALSTRRLDYDHTIPNLGELTKQCQQEN